MMSDQERKSYYEKEDDVYGPNNNNSLYSNGTLHYCSIYRYVFSIFNIIHNLLNKSGKLIKNNTFLAPYLICCEQPVFIL